MIEHELSELLRGVRVSCFKPVDRYVQSGCELAERLDARLPRVRFESADIGVGDTLACECALAQP